MATRARLLTYAVIALSLGLGALGQVLLKSGASDLGGEGGPLQTALAGLTDVLVVLGLTAYAVSSGFWLVAISRVPLSVAYPLAAANHVVVALAAVALGETLPPVRWLGVGFVVGGVALLGYSDLRSSAALGRAPGSRPGSIR